MLESLKASIVYEVQRTLCLHLNHVQYGIKKFSWNLKVWSSFMIIIIIIHLPFPKVFRGTHWSLEIKISTSSALMQKLLADSNYYVKYNSRLSCHRVAYFEKQNLMLEYLTDTIDRRCFTLNLFTSKYSGGLQQFKFVHVLSYTLLNSTKSYQRRAT